MLYACLICTAFPCYLHLNVHQCTFVLSLEEVIHDRCILMNFFDLRYKEEIVKMMTFEPATPLLPLQMANLDAQMISGTHTRLLHCVFYSTAQHWLISVIIDMTLLEV